MEKSLQEAEEKMHKAYSDAGRLVEEAEQKAKAAVAAEAVRVKAEYERRLEQDLSFAALAALGDADCATVSTSLRSDVDHESEHGLGSGGTTKQRRRVCGCPVSGLHGDDVGVRLTEIWAYLVMEGWLLDWARFGFGAVKLQVVDGYLR
ncbi:hypothetical protein M0R45_000818 [Rubus argutus]|uniref:Uncharacterized protein n=1 Tax=Rubus argutus TaxID=59490 RepID=A0AAW1VJS9_RUBAR